MERTKGKSISGLLGFAVITAVLAVFAADLPVLAAGLPLVLAYMAGRFSFSGAALGVAAIAAVVLVRPNAAIALVLAAAPVSLAAAWSVRKRRRFSTSVIFASTMALIGVALVFGFMWLMKGITPVEYIVNSTNALFGQLSDSEVTLAYQSVRMMDLQTGAITQEALLMTPRAQAISVMISMLREAANEMLVAVVLIWSLLAGLLCFLIARRGAVKAGMKVSAIPAFSDWALPKGFWLAFVGSYAGALLAESLDLIPTGLLTPTVVSVYAFVFSVQALSLSDFLFKMRDMRKGLRIVIHVAAVLLFGTYLMWIGIFENLVQFRRRSQEKGGEEF